MGKTFLLIHGAWCVGWCWNKLARLLKEHGHTVIAPDMPGHGKNTLPIEEQNLETYSRMVESLIASISGKVVLVGHSFGGMIISQAASYIPSKIEKLVYISAFLPEDGQSCSGITKSVRPTFHEKVVAYGSDFILSADGKTSKLPLDVCADFVYSDINRDRALEIAKNLCRESNAAQNQRIALNNKFYSLPKVYVRCLFDKTVDIKLQDKMISQTHCDEVYTLKTGHCPFESAPKELADILLNI